jgi:hypothetical protein
MERKEITTVICCETAKGKKRISVNPRMKQFEVMSTVQNTKSVMALKSTSIAEAVAIKDNTKPESDLGMDLQGRKEEEREFKDEEGGYEDDQEDNAVEDEEAKNVFKHREEEREFVEEKGGYEDDKENNVEDAEDENGFTEMDEEGGYKDEDEGEEC